MQNCGNERRANCTARPPQACAADAFQRDRRVRRGDRATTSIELIRATNSADMFRTSDDSRLHVRPQSRRCDTARTRTSRPRSTPNPASTRPCVATAEQLHGKELSYNNILDLDSALNLAREFAGPACVVVKHNNPCGAATAAKLADAFNARVGRRPAVRVRRHHRVQPAGRCRHRQRHHGPEGEAVRRVRHRPGLRAARPRRPQEVEGERPAPEDRRTGRLPAGARLPPRRWRAARANPRRRGRQAGRVEVVTKRKPTEEEFHAAALRLVRLQAREESNAIVLANATRTSSASGPGRCARVVRSRSR